MALIGNTTEDIAGHLRGRHDAQTGINVEDVAGEVVQQEVPNFASEIVVSAEMHVLVDAAGQQRFGRRGRQ